MHCPGFFVSVFSATSSRKNLQFVKKKEMFLIDPFHIISSYFLVNW